MTDQTTETLRKTMVAIVEIAPDAPSLPSIPATAPVRRARQPILVAAAVFAVVLVVGIGTVYVTGGIDANNSVGQQVVLESGSTPIDDQPTTPATWAPADVVYDSEAALAWHDWVTEGLVFNGWERDIASAYETPNPITNGGSVTAVVRDDDDRLVLVVGLQAFAPGEYRIDPMWQQEVAGSTEPGQITPDGTLFVADQDPVIHLVLLINEQGLLTIKAEATPTDPLPDTETLESLAHFLAQAITPLVEPLADSTTSELSEDTPVEDDALAEPDENDWTLLPNGVSIARVTEPNDAVRIWTKTATQPPTPAPSTDTYTLYVDLDKETTAVLVVAQPDKPGKLRVRWKSGETNIVDVDWTGDPEIGVATVSKPEGVSAATIALVEPISQ